MVVKMASICIVSNTFLGDQLLHLNVVCLSVRLYTVVNWYILQQKCLNKWIQSRLLRTSFYNNFDSYADPEPTNYPLNIRIARLSDSQHDYSTQWSACYTVW